MTKCVHGFNCNIPLLFEKQQQCDELIFNAFAELNIEVQIMKTENRFTNAVEVHYDMWARLMLSSAT